MQIHHVLNHFFVKRTLLFITTTFVCGNLIVAQQKHMEVFDAVDHYVRHHSPKDGLAHVDGLLTKTSDTIIQNALNTAKLHALIQAEMYDTTLEVSQNLLRDSKLDVNFKIITYIRRSLI